MEPVKLFVDTNSWHFRYYCHIRKLLGLSEPSGKNSSLCPYFQTIVLGSLVFVLTLPLQILGWLALRGCRWSYRLAEQSGFIKLIDFVDSTFFGTALEKSDDHLESSLIWTLVGWGVTALMIVGSAITVLSILFVGGWHALLLLPKIPMFIYWVLMTIGWSIIQFFYGVAWIVVTVATAIWFAATWVFTNLIWLFTTRAVWEGVLYWLCLAVCVVGATVATAYAVMQLLNTETAKKAITFIKMKFNGFHEANEKAKKRRKVAKMDAEALLVNLKKEQVKRENSLLYRFEAFLDFAALGIKEFFISKSVKVKGVAGKALSIASVFGLGLWAIKQRACPMIEFVNLDSEKPEAVKTEFAHDCACHDHTEGAAANAE